MGICEAWCRINYSVIAGQVWLRGRCATHFFRKGTVILPHLSASGARADTYPARRAARGHLRQTCRSFSNPGAGTEMRVAHALAPRQRVGTRFRITTPFFRQYLQFLFHCQPSLRHCARPFFLPTYLYLCAHLRLGARDFVLLPASYFENALRIDR